MSQDQPSTIDEEPQTPCRWCEQLKRILLDEVCQDCFKEVLVDRLPLLRRTLEERYGPVLDEWLANGRFHDARWAAEIKIQPATDRMTDLVREVVRESVRKEEVYLSLPSGESWSRSE